uniref:Uncharacterized protein n=1 Tax=Tanacetum cinerariifolium TaxID=118510 RepID=A0A6L2JCY7_TANCI|nr:hypothetical protein [Tanacetum cinerariifolium]
MESSKTKLEKGKIKDAVSYATTRIQIKRDAEADPHSANSQVSMHRQTRELIQSHQRRSEKSSTRPAVSDHKLYFSTLKKDGRITEVIPSFHRDLETRKVG